MFRDAYARRRCVIPSDGFYEWRREGKERVPFWFHRDDGRPLLFAGLYESWRPRADEWERTFTIVTTRANELVSQLHDRMPVVLEGEAADRWMFRTTPSGELPGLLEPAREGLLVMTPVSQRVNSVANDDPSLMEPNGRTGRLL
jgi:putative SOS response-associated peptidase YedK